MLPPAAAGVRLMAFLLDVVVAAIPAGIAAAGAVAAAQSVTSQPVVAWAAGIVGFMVATMLVLEIEIAIGGTTVGTRANGLTVVDGTGTRAGRAALMRRELARLGMIELPALVAGAGLMGIAPCARRGRGWHDVASGTRVVAPGESDLELFQVSRGRRFAPGGAEYASFSERSGAFLIDLGLVTTVWLTAAGIASLATDTHADHVPRWFGILVVAMFPVIDIVYRVTALTWRGTTVGLGALGYVMRRAEDEGDTHFGRALRRELLGRWVVTYGSLFIGVGIVIIPLDLLMPLWQSRRQTLHDQVGATVVVRGEPRPWRRRTEPVPATPPEPVPA